MGIITLLTIRISRPVDGVNAVPVGHVPAITHEQVDNGFVGVAETQIENTRTN